jgi:hypothetical protein
MAPKQKKEAAAAKAAAKEAAEPEAKKAKVEEPKKDEPKKDEPEKKSEKEEEPKFEEPDAPKDSRAPIKETVTFANAETTLNVIPTMGGNLLTSITDGGMSFLLAGARANVGLKAGRYMFEVRTIQNLQGGHDKQSRPMLKVGFSTAASSLFLGEDAMSVCFDSEGAFTSEKKRNVLQVGAKARFVKEKTVAVVLNLDAKSPNANTINLYIDGEKITDPKPLPEGLKGEPLFPHVTWRNMSIQVNFGPTPFKDLPFKCRMVSGAASSDASVAASKEQKDGKYEVVMPVAFPNEGTFDWLDEFLAKNPKYVELSDRKIVDWCKSSGLWYKGSPGGSNDKPSLSFGLPGLDDFSVRNVIKSIAPCVPRNYVVMEVKSNLLSAERKEIIKKFNYPCFKKVAHVVMGKPAASFKGMVQDKLLKEKQAKADVAWKAKKEADDRKKAVEKRQKELQKQREEAKKKKEAEKKKDGEKEEEKKEEEEKKDEPMEEKEVEDDKDAEPPAVELTEEEKAMCFLPKRLPDITPSVLSTCFGKFSIPEEEEGFDDIRYDWDKAAAAEVYLKNWVLQQKLTSRIDSIKPGEFFKEKLANFEKTLKDWQIKQKTTKKSAKKATDDDGEEKEDVFAIENILDVEGAVLFENFAYEDWELVKLRFELALLILSFKKDCDDPDREGIPLNHLAFYYQRYFQKNFEIRMYGVADEKALFTLVKDTVAPKESVLVEVADHEQLVSDGLDMFVKRTEDRRRERCRRIDAGDETARLKFLPASAFSKPVQKPKTEAKPAESKKPEADEPPAAPKVVAPPNRAAKSAQQQQMTPAPKVEAKGKATSKGNPYKGKRENYGKGY